MVVDMLVNSGSIIKMSKNLKQFSNSVHWISFDLIDFLLGITGNNAIPIPTASVVSAGAPNDICLGSSDKAL